MKLRAREMTETYLEPCPFCGCAASLNEFEDQECFIACESRECSMVSVTTTKEGRQHAIKAWNTRATGDAVSTRVARDADWNEVIARKIPHLTELGLGEVVGPEMAITLVYMAMVDPKKLETPCTMDEFDVLSEHGE